MKKEIKNYLVILPKNEMLLVKGVKPKKNHYFIWKDEVHKYHSDAGYGIKTWTQFNHKDGSSLLVNHSNAWGQVIASNFLETPTVELAKDIKLSTVTSSYEAKFKKTNGIFIVTDVTLMST